MKRRTDIRTRVPIAAALALGLALAVGCQWQAPVTRSDHAYWAWGAADRDSIETVLASYERTMQDNQRLRDEVAELKAEVANGKAELAHQHKVNKANENELRLAKDDLERVERQFVSFEERLTRQDTKASAVAAIAEVQLVYDRLKQEHPEVLDRAARAEINAKINTADDLMEDRKYAAAVYFAERAMRLVTSAESRAGLGDDAMRRVVAVTTANLRGGPGQNYRIVSQLAYGTVLIELSREKEWYRVQTRSGRQGWIHRSLLR